MSKSLGLEIIEQLTEMGSDIDQPHNFDFYIYLPSEAAAREVGVRTEKSGMGVKILPAASGPSWLCKATLRMVPNKAHLDEMGKSFEEIAVAFAGEFDGWESDIVKLDQKQTQ